MLAIVVNALMVELGVTRFELTQAMFERVKVNTLSLEAADGVIVVELES